MNQELVVRELKGKTHSPGAEGVVAFLLNTSQTAGLRK